MAAAGIPIVENRRGRGQGPGPGKRRRKSRGAKGPTEGNVRIDQDGLVDGNVAPSDKDREVNGNVAPPDLDIDDNFGNR